MTMHEKKPDWLKIRVKSGQNQNDVFDILDKLSLHTVCQEASCPNIMECFNRRTATFMILGKVCTRNCTFCDVKKGCAEQVDEDEPCKVAEAVRELRLRHVVITSVTRDDLADGGAEHYVKVVREIGRLDEKVVTEVLIPDFQGNITALQRVVDAKPDIINHNIETVPSLYPEVRPMAVYMRSLELLKNVKALDAGIYTKSGIMLGLGETETELLQVFNDLRKVHCDFLTLGQYLAPSKNHHPVVEYIHPDTFERLKDIALKTGFRHVASGPLVRSSYLAENALKYR